MADQETIQLPLGGQFRSGHPALMPDGHVRLMQNMLSRSGGQWVKRFPYVADESMASVQGLAIFDDSTNQVQRLVAFVKNGSNIDLYLKGTSGQTYGAAVTGTNVAGYLADYANYRGQLYYTITSSTSGAQVPGGLFATTGSAVKTYPLGGETLFALTVTPFVDRLFLGYVRSSVTNQLGTTTAYDASGWTATTTTVSTLTNGSTVTSRLTPTATTLSKIEKADVYTVAASTSDTVLIFRSDLRNTSPTYEMPMTTEIYYSQVWTLDTTYAVGAIRVATSSAAAGAQLLRFRVTAVAGTAKSHLTTEPTWPTTVSGTVVDNEVTWIADGLKEIASTPVTLPTLSANENWITTWARATTPPLPASAKVGVRIKFGTTAISTITLAAVDVSLKDGITDGDARKNNKGQQLTTGKFYYPFFNQESSASATVDLDNDIYWTETSDPNTIRGSNFFKLREVPGKVTAAAAIGGSLVVFKRRGMWVFQGTSDPDNPLVKEDFHANVGCVGPRSVITFEDKLYFIGDGEIYRWSPGGEPEPICGDAMRDELFSSGGVSPNSNGPLTACLSIDIRERDLWAGLGASANYVYNIDRNAWSACPGPVESLVPRALAGLTWCDSTRQMYGWSRFGTTLYRLDPDVVSAGDAATAAALVQFRPIETLFPGKEISLDEIGIHHMTSGSQSGVTFMVEVSLDGGATFTKYNQVTLPTVVDPLTSTRTPVPLRQSGANLVVRLSHSGNFGDDIFRLCAVDAKIRVLGPRRNITNPTSVAASL